jgi:hypothetical protein
MVLAQKLYLRQCPNTRQQRRIHERGSALSYLAALSHAKPLCIVLGSFGEGFVFEIEYVWLIERLSVDYGRQFTFNAHLGYCSVHARTFLYVL